MRQVLLGAAHFAFAIRPSCLFAYGRLAPFTFVPLTDAGLSLLAQSLHSKAYFYRFGCAVRLSVLPFIFKVHDARGYLVWNFLDFFWVYLLSSIIYVLQFRSDMCPTA